jgi:hypothetical protein
MDDSNRRNCGQAFCKSADVGRIIGEDVIRKANLGDNLRLKFGDCFIRKTEIGAQKFHFDIHFRS